MMAAIDHEVVEDAERWRGLLLSGAWAALASVALIIVQVALYVAWPPPETTIEFFELLLNDPFLGVISLDGIYIVSNLLAYLLYFALAVPLWRVSRSAVVVALALGTLGMAAYLASPRPVEMLSLSWAYSGADAAERVALVATGDGMLATWKGTAFDVYYFFNLVTLLILALLMFRSTVFTRPTATWGVIAAVLMAVPSNFGVVGVVFSLLSLVPWTVFAVLVGRQLLHLAGRPLAGRPRRSR